MEYKIIWNWDPVGPFAEIREVEKQVNEYIKNGWKPCGNLCVNKDGIFQAMIKE